MTVLSSLETDMGEPAVADAFELALRIEAAEHADWHGEEAKKTFALVAAHACELGINPCVIPTPLSLDLTKERLEKWSQGKDLPHPLRMKNTCQWLARTIAEVEAGAAA